MHIISILCCDEQNVRNLSIGDLLEGVTYLVQVQALSRAGPGHVASIHFRTPLLQLVPVGGLACFFRVSHTSSCAKLDQKPRTPCQLWFPHFILFRLSVCPHLSSTK